MLLKDKEEVVKFLEEKEAVVLTEVGENLQVHFL